MLFNRLVIASLIASSALIATVSGATAPNDADKSIRELVADLQNRIETLEGELSQSKLQQQERPRGKTRGVRNQGIRSLDVLDPAPTGKGKGKGGKSFKTPDHSICYGGFGEVGAFHINEELLGLDFNDVTMDLGVVELSKDEGLMLEITASSIIANAVGGVVEQIGEGGGVTRKLEDIPGVKRDLQGRFYITGSGLVLRPVVYICPEAVEQCEDSACIRDTCVGGPTVDMEPASVLPLTITVLGGYQENFDEGDVTDEFLGYEIDAALDLTTNTVKFYAPSDDVGDEYVYVDLVIGAGTAGIHWDLDVENWDLEDWTLGLAVLGPHLIEVTKPKAEDSECIFLDDD